MYLGTMEKNEIDDTRHVYLVRISFEFWDICEYDISYAYVCCDYGWDEYDEIFENIIVMCIMRTHKLQYAWEWW